MDVFWTFVLTGYVANLFGWIFFRKTALFAPSHPLFWMYPHAVTATLVLLSGLYLYGYIVGFLLGDHNGSMEAWAKYIADVLRNKS